MIPKKPQACRVSWTCIYIDSGGCDCYSVFEMCGGLLAFDDDLLVDHRSSTWRLFIGRNASLALAQPRLGGGEKLGHFQ